MIYFSVVIKEDQKDEKNRTYTFLILDQVEKSKFEIIARNYSCTAFVIASIHLQDIQHVVSILLFAVNECYGPQWSETSPSDAQFQLICNICMPRNTPQRISVYVLSYPCN